MNVRGEPKPPAQWLELLESSGQWERLIEIARRSLAVDPSDVITHRHLAWGYAQLDRFVEMAPHVEFMLRAQPDSVPNHHVAAVYALEVRDFSKAREHVDFLLAKAPHDATYHYLASILALRTNDRHQAREFIRQARQLSPNWAEAALFEVQIDAIGPQKTWQAWDRARRLEEMLALDPRNARVMANLGRVLLDELEQPRKAEIFFRQALGIDPSDRKAQKNLLAAMRAQSLIYRTLTLPVTVVHGMLKGSRNAALLILIMGWVVWVGIYFLPAAWIYERMVLTDYIPVRWRVLAPLARMLRWPSWMRLLVSLTLISGLVFLALWKLAGVAPWEAAAIMAGVFGFHFALVAGRVGWRKLRAWLGRRKAPKAVGVEPKPVASGPEAGN